MSRLPAPTKPLRIEVMPCVFPNAAGLAIGSTEMVAAVAPDRVAEPVRIFGTFTPDRHALVDWLVTLGIDTVALESTGVSWVPIDELLEQRGITPYLVNTARGGQGWRRSAVACDEEQRQCYCYTSHS